MHPLYDPHDPRNELDRLDGIALAALGESIDPVVAAHHQSCPRCLQEWHDLQHTVRLAREAVEPLRTRDVGPPASVWAGIAADLGISNASPATPMPMAATVPVAVRRVRTSPLPRRWLVAAAAAALLLGASAISYSFGRHEASPVASSCPITSASLQQLPGGPGSVDGQAVLVCSAHGPSLRVTTERLPLREGFYQVWLYAPTSNKMVAVGTLGRDGTGSFTLPAGVDLHDYHVVDVSAQLYNGNPAHDQSVLRGPLTS